MNKTGGRDEFIFVLSVLHHSTHTSASNKMGTGHFNSKYLRVVLAHRYDEEGGDGDGVGGRGMGDGRDGMGRGGRLVIVERMDGMGGRRG